MSRRASPKPVPRWVGADKPLGPPIRQYVVAENGGGSYVAANRDAIGPWETFQLVNLSGGKTALRAATLSKYVVAENGRQPLRHHLLTPAGERRGD